MIANYFLLVTAYKLPQLYSHNPLVYAYYYIASRWQYNVHVCMKFEAPWCMNDIIASVCHYY